MTTPNFGRKMNIMRTGILKERTFLIMITMFMVISFGAFGSANATDYPFSDDMENPASGNWTLEGTWGYTETFSYSPTHSLTDSPSGNYGNNTDISATLSTPIDLTTAVRPVLSFWYMHMLETDSDYGFVEVSNDGGSSWTVLSYVTGQQPDWAKMTIDLTEYAGLTDLEIRFRLISNSSTAYDGWYIDDVQVDEATATIPYPFFDDMEDPAASEINWLFSSWQIETPGADGSTYCWSSDSYSQSAKLSLTLANVLDLSVAEHQQLTFWHRGDGGNRHVDVSDNNGYEGSWQRLATYSATSNDWVQEQIDLTDYQGLPNVRIRFLHSASAGRYWEIDNIRIEDSAWPHGTLHQPTDVTMHGAHLSWDEMDIAGFDRYEIYRATSENVSRSNGELVCQVFDPLVTECDDTCSDPSYIILQPDYYWYRMYVVDVNGMYSVGSNSRQAIYQVPLSDYPFFDDMESGTGNWEWNCPWGLTDQFSHGGSYAWTDSPGGNYSNDADTTSTIRLDLSTAVKPVLSFWYRHTLEADQDRGFVEVSNDGGSSWTVLSYVTGQQPDWVKMTIDLTEYAGLTDLGIRFHLTSNSSTAYDGWYIDDVQVDETTTSIPYPFFDDMEDPAASEINWLFSSWQIETPGVDGSTYCWSSDSLGYHDLTLTLANVLDLSLAEHPQLTFWHRGDGGNRHVDVSDNNGYEGSWQRLATYSGTNDEWVQEQIDLTDYQGLPNVRIRFVHSATGGRLWQIDNISIRGVTLVVGNELAVDFNVLGIYVYNVDDWNRVYVGLDPEDICPYGDYLVANFGTTYGLYLYDSGEWTLFYRGVPVEKMSEFANKLAVDFGTTYGIYEYNYTTDAWKWIYRYSSPRDSLVGFLDKLVADFKTLGIWIYQGSDWDRIYNGGIDPIQITGFGDKLAVDFGVAYGLYVYEFDTDDWSRVYKGVEIQKLTPFGEKLAVDFGTTYGLYLYDYDTDTWERIYKGVDIEKMTEFAGKLAVDFGATYGIYEYDYAADAWNRIYKYDADRDEMFACDVYE